MQNKMNQVFRLLTLLMLFLSGCSMSKPGIPASFRERQYVLKIGSGNDEEYMTSILTGFDFRFLPDARNVLNQQSTFSLVVVTIREPGQLHELEARIKACDLVIIGMVDQQIYKW